MIMNRRWIKGMPENLNGLPLNHLAAKVGMWVMNESKGKPGSYGLNINSRIIDPSESEIFCEMVKIHVFLTSHQTLFAKGVRLSKRQNQVLLDVVMSNAERSRNYLARKAGDAVDIPHHIVQVATAYAFAFNTGVIGLNVVWYPPIAVTFPDEMTMGRMFQLLGIIFTLERVFPVWERDEHGHWRVISHPFDPCHAALFLGGMYEQGLMKKLSLHV